MEKTLTTDMRSRLAIDPRRLEVPGRKRLDIEYGEPIDAIIA